MKKKHLTVVLVLYVFIFSSTISTFTDAGECTDATRCFCELMPAPCGVLITGEVVDYYINDLSEHYVSIRVVGVPHYDPQGKIESDQLLLLIRNYAANYGRLPVGAVGLFNVHPPGYCNPESVYIGVVRAVMRSGGVLECNYDYEFPGATIEEVVSAVLSEDCKSEVHKLGVVDPCDRDGDYGCCTSVN